MKISEAKYTRKVNLGNYESDELSLTMVIGENDDTQEAITLLKKTVIAGLKLEVSDKDIVKAQKTIEKEAAKEEPKSEEKVEAPKEEAKPKAVSKGKKTSPSTTKAKKDDAETKEIKEKFEGKAPKATIKYDRNVKEHTIALAQMLNTDYPNWKKDEDLKARASKFSKEDAIGIPFKAADGSIVESFQQALKAAMEGSSEDDL